MVTTKEEQIIVQFLDSNSSASNPSNNTLKLEYNPHSVDSIQQQSIGSNNHTQLQSTETMDNSIHKQASPNLMGAPRSSISQVATTVTTQSIPLTATTSSSLVNVSSASSNPITTTAPSNTGSSSAVSAVSAAAAAAVNAAAAAVNAASVAAGASIDPDEGLSIHEDSGDITVQSTVDQDGADGALGEESSRRVNLSGTEKLLLVKTFVDHEREFFDSNVRNRDFWIMVNQKFSAIIDRPFKTARQAIYRYVKSAETEDLNSPSGQNRGNQGSGSDASGSSTSTSESQTRPSSTQQGDASTAMDALAQVSVDNQLSITRSPSGVLRRKGDEDFSKYVERAVDMFKCRKDVKERRIKRNSSLALPAGNSSGYIGGSPQSLPYLTQGQIGASPGGVSIPGSSSSRGSSSIKTNLDERGGASAEDFADGMQHLSAAVDQHLPASHNPMSPTPATKGSIRAGAHAHSLLSLHGPPAAMSTPSLADKRALNPADAYGSRKKFKSSASDHRNHELNVEADLRIQALEKRIESLCATVEFQQKRFEDFTKLCSQVFSSITSKLDVENPFETQSSQQLDHTSEQDGQSQQQQHQPSEHTEPSSQQAQSQLQSSSEQYSQQYEQIQSGSTQVSSEHVNQNSRNQELIQSVIHPDLIEAQNNATSNSHNQEHAQTLVQVHDQALTQAQNEARGEQEVSGTPNADAGEIISDNQESQQQQQDATTRQEDENEENDTILAEVHQIHTTDPNSAVESSLHHTSAEEIPSSSAAHSAVEVAVAAAVAAAASVDADGDVDLPDAVTVSHKDEADSANTDSNSTRDDVNVNNDTTDAVHSSEETNTNDTNADLGITSNEGANGDDNELNTSENNTSGHDNDVEIDNN